MAARGLGGAVRGVGQALMRREDIERQDELIAGERARQDELLTRQEKRDDLVTARQVAIERAREIRQDLVRGQERAADREFQLELSGAQMANQAQLAGAENELMGRRLDDQDRRAVEDQATTQLAALDNRIVELQDMALKGEVLGSEGEVERQIAEAEAQKLSIRSALVNRLFEMGDPRYKDMPADQRAYAAGYSKDQVVDMMRAQAGGVEEVEEPAAEEPAARSDAEIAASVRNTDPARVAQYGLSDQDRSQIGLPTAPQSPSPLRTGFRTTAAEGPSAAMAAPESPPPLRDMTQAGRGRRLLSPSPGGGARTPRANREAREARELAAKEPTAAQKQATEMQRTIDTLLQPFGGDIEKASPPVRQVVEVLRAQLRDLES